MALALLGHDYGTRLPAKPAGLRLCTKRSSAAARTLCLGVMHGGACGALHHQRGRLVDPNRADCARERGSPRDRIPVLGRRRQMSDSRGRKLRSLEPAAGARWAVPAPRCGGAVRNTAPYAPADAGAYIEDGTAGQQLTGLEREPRRCSRKTRGPTCGQANRPRHTSAAAARGGTWDPPSRRGRSS